MKEVVKTPLKFVDADNDVSQFYVTLKNRIAHYFESTGKSQYGNANMYFKTVFMLGLFLIPYFMILSNSFSAWMMFGLTFLMGLGVAGIGLCVMHDANHGSYSSNPVVNKILGYTLNFIGASVINWKIQHNVLHHSFTNIAGKDEDVTPVGLLRFSPHAKLKKIHRYQFLYAWFFYGLMTLSWILVKDFGQLKRYYKDKMLKAQRTTIGKEVVILSVTKLIYISYIFVLPLLLVDVTWWQLLIGFVTMHYTAGFILALIFQLAHIMEDTTFPVPDKDGKISNNWAIHQLQTTANFSRKSRFFSWYVGGLNFQVEHHLFPGICHVHYKKLSALVEKTAHEFRLPYNSYPTFIDALIVHIRFLKKLGREEGNVFQVA